MMCSVCDDHGIVVAWQPRVKRWAAWAGAACPVCDPFVGKVVDGIVSVVAPETGEVHVLDHGYVTEAPGWYVFGWIG